MQTFINKVEKVIPLSKLRRIKVQILINCDIFLSHFIKLIKSLLFFLYKIIYDKYILDQSFIDIH